MTDEVFPHLTDGGVYNCLAITGHDGQSGRGSSGIKGKKVNDDKR